MPLATINELAVRFVQRSDSTASSRNPIRANIFLTRLNRAQNEQLQLQYSAIYSENSSIPNNEIPINTDNHPNENVEPEREHIIRIRTQSQSNHLQSENTSTESKNLLKEISHWYTPENLDSKPLLSQPEITKLAHWKMISQNNNSASFSKFLSKLRACAVVTHSSEFKQHISTFLDNIVLSPSMAETLFAIASDGTTSCNDKTLFTYNQMQQMMIIDDIDKGKYDTQLDALIVIARRVYRIRQLNMIANQHMKRHPNTDEIEVYLGFQTRLHSALDLQHFAPDMHSFICSKISSEDLRAAEKIIKKNENIQFPSWLAQWKPLHALIERLAPEKIHAAQEKRYHMLEFEYQKHIDDLLRKNLLKGIPDAEINAGKIVLNKMQLDIDRALIADFFSQHHLSSAIYNEFWTQNKYSRV